MSLDRIVDDVARGIVRLDPPPEFVAATMARVGARQRLWVRSGWFQVGAVASLATVLALTFWRVDRGNELPIVRAVTSSDARRPELPALDIDAAGWSIQARRPRASVISPEELAWHERRLPALPPPAPIVTEDIQPEPLELPLLEVKPLASVPLQLAPLDGGR